MEVCGLRFLFGNQECRRGPKHNGLHRDALLSKEATVWWGDNECAPTEEGATK